MDQNYHLHQFINSVHNVKAYMSKDLRVCRLAKYCVLVVHVAGCAAFCILGSCLRLCTSCGHFEAVDDQVVLAGATTCSSGGGHWAGPHAPGGILLFWQGWLSSRVTRRNLIWCWQCFRNLLRGGGAVQQCPVEGGQWGILGRRQHFDLVLNLVKTIPSLCLRVFYISIGKLI